MEELFPTPEPPTFLHVRKALLQLMVHLRTEGKVIHKNNTVKREEEIINQKNNKMKK